METVPAPPAQPVELTEQDVARAMTLVGLPSAPERLAGVTREYNRSLRLATLLDPLLVPRLQHDVTVSFAPFDPAWPEPGSGEEPGQ